MRQKRIKKSVKSPVEVFYETTEDERAEKSPIE